MFRAYHPEQDRLVAVKLFRLDVPPDRVHRFAAALEALVAADLSHAAIAAPIAAGLADTLPYLALDFVAAESLDVYARDSGPVKPTDLLRIAGQLASGLDFAAEAGVLHGALHPRDVLVSADDVRMTGLGIAQAIAHAGVAAPVRRPYMAPERTANGAWDRRADVYSLAALVFEHIAARRLSGSVDQAVQSIEPSEGSVRALRDVLRTALAEDPDARFATSAEFVDELRAAFSAPAGARAPRRRRKAGDTPPPAAAVAAPPPPELDLPLIAALRDQPASPLDLLDPEPPPHVEVDGIDVRVERPARDVDRDFDLSGVFAGESAEVAPPTAPEAAPDAPPDAAPEMARAVGEFDAEIAVPVAASTDTDDSRVNGSLPLTAKPDVAPAVVRDDVLPRVERALERTRSALWPLVLALVVGIAIGFGMAMAILGRDQGIETAAVTQESGPAADAARVVDEPPIVPPAEPDAAAAANAPRATAQPPAGGSGTPPAASAAGSSPATRAGAAAGTAAPTRAVADVPRPAASAGRILVRSTPSGARVLVDGRPIGATPATVRELAAGSYTVRVERDGYRPVERRVSITNARPAQSLTVTLERARSAPAAPAARDRRAEPSPARGGNTNAGTTGSLFVNSRPAGAKVFVDGKLIGTTPLMLPELALGEHTVLMELDGYRRWASSVRIAPGEESRVTGSLEK